MNKLQSTTESAAHPLLSFLFYRLLLYLNSFFLPIQVIHIGEHRGRRERENRHRCEMGMCVFQSIPDKDNGEVSKKFSYKFLSQLFAVLPSHSHFCMNEDLLLSHK